MAGNSSNEGKTVKRKESPLITVIIPAYNCAATLGQAIESALAQEVDLEVLVMDDCGKENLDQVMAGYQKNPVIRYVKNEKNLGVAATRNRGVELAKGKYIAFLDADDWWEKGKLKKQLACMEKTKSVLCTTARELVTQEGKRTGKVIPVKEVVTYGQMLGSNSINCSAVLLKTEVAKEFPMCHEDSHEDYIMWLKILKKYKTACGVNEPLLKYRVSSSGKSGNKLHSAGMTFKVYRYVGFGYALSCLCFVRYAFHGVEKYAKAYLGKKKGE